MQACCTVLYPVLMPMMAKRKINYVVNTVVTGPVLSLPLAQILMTYRYIIIPTEELISWTRLLQQPGKQLLWMGSLVRLWVKGMKVWTISWRGTQERTRGTKPLHARVYCMT